MDGPSTSLVSGQVTLLNQNGSRVTFGNLLLIPIDKTLLWVRPLYVSSDSTPQPLVQRVIVAYEENGVLRISIRETSNRPTSSASCAPEANGVLEP